ncbi:MAG: DUF4197 domain-containing protein [Chitinophagales bacterium]|nr:DUF4197 domain-containing protein [Bacteroidota bacterium]MBK9507036.1 DUF4197 domain-containing protein [Bacteroidota bacterium]MBK9554673.1 DUF4197 domain-containing protein [Bacteroidota bacterium]MBP8248937.1 DUF4197 domain-containing protein [Chitinophagales bacterium]MBP9880041.1 DUF4197 domain-containing protein [Chitinophagales bacterium]
MKKIHYLFLLPFAASTFFISCEDINIDDLLSDGDVAAALREALTIGTDTAVTKGSAIDGYFANPDIKILFPEEAAVVESVVGVIPGGDVLIDEFIQSVNRAAEDAADEATPIIKDAIVNITFDDAMTILNGTDTAATNYLRLKTFSDLYTAFKPDIQNSLEGVGAQQAWEEVIDLYNTIPFVEDVNTDLADYSTNKGLDGLFILLGQEEGKIRTDVEHQVTSLLQEVFGGN